VVITIAELSDSSRHWRMRMVENKDLDNSGQHQDDLRP